MFSIRSPVEILVDAVAEIVGHDWERLRREGIASINESTRDHLHTAYHYLNARERGIYKLEREKNLSGSKLKSTQEDNNKKNESCF